MTNFLFFEFLAQFLLPYLIKSCNARSIKKILLGDYPYTSFKNITFMK